MRIVTLAVIGAAIFRPSHQPLRAQEVDLAVVLEQAENAIAQGAMRQAVDSVLSSHGVGGVYFADLTDLRVAVDQPAGETVFVGWPSAKTTASGTGASLQRVPPEDAREFQVRIVEIGDRLYWVTRDYKRMIAFDGPVFVRYQAWDATGYVKALKMRNTEDDEIDPVTALSVVLRLGEGGHTYFEHLVGQGLTGNITYWGIQMGNEAPWP